MKKTYIRPFAEEVKLNVSDVLTYDKTWNVTSEQINANKSDAKRATWNEDDDLWDFHANNVWDN